MACKKWIFRILLVAGGAAFAVILLAFIVVQFQQHLLRWRAEQLMADMHQIRLYQSTWADAQKLMHRWGAWGHYDGSCTAADCRYEINLMDVGWKSLQSNHYPHGMGYWLLHHKMAYVLSRWFGDRFAFIHCAFIVQDGSIWRMETSVNIATSPKFLNKDDIGYVLNIVARSQQALRESKGGGWVLGDDDQLAYHPYYKVGQPNGCEGCILVGITYSTHTPQFEIDQLTDFHLYCLTSFISCKRPDELLPIAREWNIHNYADPDNQGTSVPTKLYKPCDIPLWALSRDNASAYVIDAIPTVEQEKANYQESLTKKDIIDEEVNVRIIEQLKGTDAWQPGSVVYADTYLYRNSPSLSQISEHLTKGKRYILLGSGNNYQSGRIVFVDTCGVQEDTPEVRRELEKGFAQNDNLRGPELR
jgi:hypothetical protein